MREVVDARMARAAVEADEHLARAWRVLEDSGASVDAQGHVECAHDELMGIYEGTDAEREGVARSDDARGAALSVLRGVFVCKHAYSLLRERGEITQEGYARVVDEAAHKDAALSMLFAHMGRAREYEEIRREAHRAAGASEGVGELADSLARGLRRSLSGAGAPPRHLREVVVVEGEEG